MNKDQIKKLIREGKLQEALKTLKSLNRKEQEHPLSLIEAEYNTLNQEIIQGLITDDQRLLRTNRINDKLLRLLDQDPASTVAPKRNKLLLALIPIGLLVLAYGAFSFFPTSKVECPEFSQPSNNKILLIPFENVGNQAAKPHILLRDRIDELSLKKDLSTTIKLGKCTESISLGEAPGVAKECGANVIIWGKYSHANDSLRLILQYHFLEHPDWSKMSDLVILKDVTAIQNGTMSKNLEDAIMSLCSLIAIRQDKKDLTKKWLNKIKHKEEVDQQLLKALK